MQTLMLILQTIGGALAFTPIFLFNFRQIVLHSISNINITLADALVLVFLFLTQLLDLFGREKRSDSKNSAYSFAVLAVFLAVFWLMSYSASTGNTSLINTTKDLLLTPAIYFFSLKSVLTSRSRLFEVVSVWSLAFVLAFAFSSISFGFNLGFLEALKLPEMLSFHRESFANSLSVFALSPSDAMVRVVLLLVNLTSFTLLIKSADLIEFRRVLPKIFFFLIVAVITLTGCVIFRTKVDSMISSSSFFCLVISFCLRQSRARFVDF